MEDVDRKNALSRPVLENGRYKNPWETWRWYKTTDMIKYVLIERSRSEKLLDDKELDSTLPIIPLNADDFADDPGGVRISWVGHAGVIFQFDGVTVLTDPVFGSRIGPPYLKLVKRYRESPCTVRELPQIDAVVISHNHYDHLDTDTVRALNERFGQELAWFVPAGMAGWMRECGVETVTELTWWESARIEGNDDVTFVCTPAQHWCGRGVFDTNKMLWCSWTIVGPKHRVFFNGDTGYCPAYEEIGRMYGPINVAAIPIGAYIPRQLTEPQHVDPEQAVLIHRDIRALKTLGIHWGTFALGIEHYLAAPADFRDAAIRHGFDDRDCFVLKHGETREITFHESKTA